MPQVKKGDFIRRKYGSFVNKEIFLVDDVDERNNGAWAHRIRVDSVGSQWIPMSQIILSNELVLKLSISAEDADYLAKSHNTRIDHAATKEWSNALKDADLHGRQYSVALLRNIAKQKEIFVSNPFFIRTVLYTGKPPKKKTLVRIVFETFLRIKV